MQTLDLPAATERRRKGGVRSRLRPQQIKVLPEIGPSLSAELEIRRECLRLLRSAAAFVAKEGLSLLPGAKMVLSVDSILIEDDITGMGIFLRLFRSYLATRTDDFSRILYAVLTKEEARHRAKFQSVVRAETKIDIDAILTSLDVRPHIETAVLRGVQSIKGMTDDLVNKVGQTIIKGANQGLRSTEVAKELNEKFGYSAKRAKMIARNEIATFNGTLNKVRQTQMGISEYEWSTSLDERVRPEHAKREGKRYKWSHPPADGHPGEPINCRCVARAVIPGID